MESKIVEQLKTGKVKNVVPFGQVSVPPAPPYIVVKEEVDPFGRGDIYRIIVHVPIGANKFLKEYMAEVQQLLDGFGAETPWGNYLVLYPEGPISGIITGNDDNTIAKERMYLCPTIHF